MKKLLTVALSLGIMLALLTGCSQPLPAGLDAATLEADAKLAVETLNARDWEGMVEVTGIDLEADEWEAQLEPYLDELGTLEEYKGVTVSGMTDKETKVEYGLALVSCKYENGDIIYRVVFDLDGKITGFWL